MQVVVFTLDGEEYATPIGDLLEIIKMEAVTPVPNAPECIKGIINLRGKIVIVVDMERRFHLTREHPATFEHIVVTEIDHTLLGIAVDQVREVVRIPLSAVKPPPDLVTAKIHAEYLKGVIVLSAQPATGGERLIMLLDIKKMLDEKELLKAGEA